MGWWASLVPSPVGGLPRTCVCVTRWCMRRPTSCELPFFQVDPRTAISEFEQLLVSNSGEDAFDVAVKLLAAKLVDELEERETGRPRRFVLQPPSPRLLREVQGLYQAAMRRWPDFNGATPELGVTAEQLSRCMRPLVGWRLLTTDLSHLDAALEQLVARDAKGELGQYFTPREVVRLCVVALNPQPKDQVIDPACGSGGFLFEAVRHALSHHKKAPSCLGMDFGARAVKVATLLANAICPGSIKITKTNSIDGRAYVSHHPREWDAFQAGSVSGQPGTVDGWGAWSRLSCTLLLTNPPFAGDVDEPAVLSAYESQRLAGANRKGTVGREHLFLERAVSLLRPGGRLAIVLPQGVLANPTASYLRRWVLTKCRVLAVVGLHPFTFVPNTGVKTSLLFLERAAGEMPTDYPVLFAVSKEPGKDSSGRLSGSSDYARIGATLSRFLFSQGLGWAANPPDEGAFAAETVSIKEVVENDRLDAEYYDHETRRLHASTASRSASRLADCVARGVERFRRGSGEIEYLDISSVDARLGTAIPTRMDAADAPSRASYVVQSGDILVSTVRPERNTVALVGPGRAVPFVASNGFCVLRPRDLPPEVLFAYCKTDSFRRLLARHATASMYPAVTDRDVLDMPFVRPADQLAKAVTERVRDGLAMLDAAKAKIEEAIRLMDEFVRKGPETPRDSAGSHAAEPGAKYRRRKKLSGKEGRRPSNPSSRRSGRGLRRP